ncbi:hypothetical protein B0H21DRAFT_820961 [Amylocystis lapponica]|nr:hypothetical protein B0H21DRAFT_820961 [Amylocystis lapponica]
MSNDSSVYKLRVVSAAVKNPTERRPSKPPKLFVKARLTESRIEKKTAVSEQSYLPEWNEEMLL